MQVKIRNILPNPFRNIQNYPINRDKVEALKASIEKTGFWDNIVGRLRKDAQVEIAYGHHRRVALQEYYPKDHVVDIIVKDFDDSDMLVAMASENMEDWGTSAVVEIETIEAVVKAFAAGKIKLPKAAENQGLLRTAPSFIPKPKRESTGTAFLYSAQTIGDFLGWNTKDGRAFKKVGTALTALQYIEEGLIELSDFANLGTAGAEAVVRQASQARAQKEAAARQAEQRAKEKERAEREAREEEARKRAEAERYRKARKEEEAREAERAEADAARRRATAAADQKHHQQQAAKYRSEGRELATKVTKAVSEHVRSGGGTKTASDVANKVAPRESRGTQPMVEQYLRDALVVIGKFLRRDDPLVSKLTHILEEKENILEDDDLGPEILKEAERTFRSLANRATYYADRFAPTTNTKKERSIY